MISLLFFIVTVVALWKLYKMAGYQGWEGIVPLYNLYVLVKISGRPGWWFLLYFVPIVNIVVHFIVSIDFAKAYGKGTGFGIGIALLSFVFLTILAFSDDTEYIGI